MTRSAVTRSKVMGAASLALVFSILLFDEGRAQESLATASTEDSLGSIPLDFTVAREVAVSSETTPSVRVGYDDGFVISSPREVELDAENDSFRLQINGWGQLRNTVFSPEQSGRELNQLQLKRARLIFSGHAFTSDFKYFVQFDGRSNASDNLSILDYYFTYDLSQSVFDCSPDTIGIRAGLYKMPFSLARQVSGKELQFSDRSVASTYFDVNRSLAWGLYGTTNSLPILLHWELAVFNGLDTGGSETGSSGTLDNNHAFSGRVQAFPIGDWGDDDLTDLDWHEQLATRIGAGFAVSNIDSIGSTEFSALRTVDSGVTLASLLPAAVDEYTACLYCIDASMKFRGFSQTFEYYFRNISSFRGAVIPDLDDHGFWLQSGYFAIAKRLELIARWSRVVGNSGSLGGDERSSDELAGGAVWYFRGQNAKLTFDATHVNGAPINSSALDISPGDDGWLYRTQLQFSF